MAMKILVHHYASTYTFFVMPALIYIYNKNTMVHEINDNFWESILDYGSHKK